MISDDMRVGFKLFLCVFVVPTLVARTFVTFVFVPDQMFVTFFSVSDQMFVTFVPVFDHPPGSVSNGAAKATLPFRRSKPLSYPSGVSKNAPILFGKSITREVILPSEFQHMAKNRPAPSDNKAPGLRS